MSVSNVTAGFMASIGSSNASFGMMTGMGKRIALINAADQVAAVYEQYVNETGKRNPDLYDKLIAPIHEMDKELQAQMILDETMYLAQREREEDAKKRAKEKIKKMFSIG